MVWNGSTAGPLTLGMEKETVVRVTGKEDPSEKRLMQSQFIWHCFVDFCCESRGSDMGGNMGRGTENSGELISVHVYRCSWWRVCHLFYTEYTLQSMHGWIQVETYSQPVTSELSQPRCLNQNVVSKKCVSQNYGLSVRPHLPLNRILYMYQKRLLLYS